MQIAIKLSKSVQQVLKLKAPTDLDVVHLLSGSVVAPETAKTSIVHITRAGKFSDPRYGDFELTTQMFDTMIENFNAFVFGQDINIDRAHEPQNGSAAVIKRLFREGKNLKAEVVWTPYGINAVNNDGLRYLSAEIHPNFEDNERGPNDERKSFGPTLLGAGLVARPCIKYLEQVDIIELSEPAPTAANPLSVPTYLSDDFKETLKLETTKMWQVLLANLKLKLAGLKLSEAQLTQLLQLAENSLKNVTVQAAAEKVIGDLVSTAMTFAETPAVQAPSSPVAPAPGLNADEIIALIEKRDAEQTRKLAETTEAQAAKVKIFSDAINGAEGLTDEIKTKLLENQSLIHLSMGEEQVIKLAENQIEYGNQMIVNEEMKRKGFSGPVGSAQFGDAQPNGQVLQLQEIQHENARLTPSFANKKLLLLADDKLNPFTTKLLAEYDRDNAHHLEAEAFVLAGNNNTLSNVDLPVGFKREVIREAYSDLTLLSLVNTLTDFSAQGTTQIPYEVRDLSTMPNDGIVYENQPIPKSSVKQKMDLAYILAMKLAFSVSDEVLHFSRASNINWDVWARNVASAAQALREIVCRRLANEMQRVSDSYGAVSIIDENIKDQINDGKASFKLSHFPLVRQYQQYDMQGNKVNDIENPFILKIDNNVVPEFNGSGDQAVGTYYTIANYNLGYVFVVDEKGAVKNAVEAISAKVSYSHATNVVFVDSDVPEGVKRTEHLNNLIQGFGKGKSILDADRFVIPDFILMSSVLNNECTDAEQFTALGKRPDADITVSGDLEAIKTIPAFKTNAPGVHFGDQRGIMGQRNTLSYTIAKTFTLSQMIPTRNENGDLTGGQEVYGAEYSCIYCPLPLRNRFISVIYYSKLARAAF